MRLGVGRSVGEQAAPAARRCERRAQDSGRSTRRVWATRAATSSLTARPGPRQAGRWARSILRGHRGPTKNPSSLRTVSLLHPVAEETWAWSPSRADLGTRYVLDALAGLAAKLPDDDGRIFPFSTQQVGRLWTRTLKQANVRYSKPHTLRHTFASVLLSRGAPVLYVVKAGGWKDATTPLRVYAKWVPGADATPGSAQPAQQTDLIQAEPDANNAPLLAHPPAGEPLRALPGEVPAARGGHRPLHARGDADRSVLEERGLARPGRVRGRAPRRPVPSARSISEPSPDPECNPDATDAW